MKNLRFLSIKNCEHIDMLLAIITKTATLKWLRIHFSTLYDNILQQHTYFINEFMNIGEDHLQQLGVLELFGIKIGTPAIFQNFQPKFLKEISFIKCTFPQGEFPVGLGKLELEELNISDCEQLKTLPKDLIHLKSLLKLDISRCTSLEEFPSGI